MKYLLIVNPVSGGGVDREKTAWVMRWFERRGHTIELRESARPGHAEELARAACAEDFDVIIGAGGDGTINEVVNGMAGSHKKLAVIPWGTGNVFADEMGFPGSTARICRMIVRGESRRIDLGRIDERRFLLMVGVGIDAYSLRLLAGQGLKKRLGRLAYLLAGLRAVVRYRFPRIDVVMDGNRHTSGGFVLVSNTRHYGNIFSFTPRARPDDGLLDVFVYRERNALATFVLALRCLFTLRGLARLQSELLTRHRTYQCRTVELHSADPAHSQADGDYHGPLPATIAIEPAALEIILPRRALRRMRRDLSRDRRAAAAGIQA